jgi:hypothetical protein
MRVRPVSREDAGAQKKQADCEDIGHGITRKG